MSSELSVHLSIVYIYVCVCIYIYIYIYIYIHMFSKHGSLASSIWGHLLSSKLPNNNDLISMLFDIILIYVLI